MYLKQKMKTVVDERINYLEKTEPVLRNFTAHDIIFLKNRRKIIFKSEGCARVKTSCKTIILNCGIVIKSKTNKIIDLPEPEENTFFIVSKIMRESVPSRTDLISPTNLKMYSEGIKGCKNFIKTIYK